MKTVNGKRKTRFTQRALELIYNTELKPDLKKLTKWLCQTKHGVLKGFFYPHTEDEKTHVHIGFVVRVRKLDTTWEALLATYEHPEYGRPKQFGKLTEPKKDFDVKLQSYWNYCTDESKHVGQTLGEPHLHKWIPKTKEQLEQGNPGTFLEHRIFEGLTLDELDDHIDRSKTWTLSVRSYGLRNYDKLEKMIEKLTEIRDRRTQAALYKDKVKTYRSFQTELTAILDDQNDRNIHCHYDKGLTGKNHFIDIEGMRQDTLIMQSAETKRIAFAWNPKKHRRIIFDIPKHKMEFINTSVIEKLKNGTLFSTMHHPKMKKSHFKPSILILGNEQLDSLNWTEDRATYSTTNKASGYALIKKVGSSLPSILPKTDKPESIQSAHLPNNPLSCKTENGKRKPVTIMGYTYI